MSNYNYLKKKKVNYSVEVNNRNGCWKMANPERTVFVFKMCNYYCLEVPTQKIVSTPGKGVLGRFYSTIP